MNRNERESRWLCLFMSHPRILSDSLLPCIRASVLEAEHFSLPQIRGGGGGGGRRRRGRIVRYRIIQCLGLNSFTIDRQSREWRHRACNSVTLCSRVLPIFLGDLILCPDFPGENGQVYNWRNCPLTYPSNAHSKQHFLHGLATQYIRMSSAHDSSVQVKGGGRGKNRGEPLTPLCTLATGVVVARGLKPDAANDDAVTRLVTVSRGGVRDLPKSVISLYGPRLVL